MLPYKMVFVVNAGLRMGAGKMAAQVGHATLAVYEHTRTVVGGPAALASWTEKDGQMKVVLRADDDEQMLALEAAARAVRDYDFLAANFFICRRVSATIWCTTRAARRSPPVR